VHPVTTSVLAKRRAERYAQLLDEAVVGGRHHVRITADDELSRLVTLGQRVSHLPVTVEVDPEFRTGLRASLMARIEREGIGATATAERPESPARARIAGLLPSGRVRGAMVVALAAGTLAVSGVSAASGDALPGDALYGLKLATERAKLAFADSDVTKGQIHFMRFQVRLAEADAVRGNPAELSRLFDEMDSEALQGSRLLATSAVARGDASALQAIEQFVGEQRARLRDLAGRLPAPSRARANRSIALLDDIGQRADALRPSLDCKSGSTGMDDFGPLPRKSCAGSAAPGSDTPTAATEATPDPGATGGGQPRNAPGGAAPSVEASTPAAPSGDKPAGDRSGGSEGGIIAEIGSIVGKLFD
jgi:hypothetical protein